MTQVGLNTAFYDSLTPDGGQGIQYQDCFLAGLAPGKTANKTAWLTEQVLNV